MHYQAHLSAADGANLAPAIMLSGLLVLAVREVATWGTAWWIATVLTLLLTAASWKLGPPTPQTTGAAKNRTRTHRWFTALALSYTLEGIGYIIAAPSPSPRSLRTPPAGSAQARGSSSDSPRSPVQHRGRPWPGGGAAPPCRHRLGRCPRRGGDAS
ncbi:YbfB/YjiJ family MFS transporter [Streptomyces sp. NPDC005820]|uniref:YbfB/YjiJ family MFS transporter n=1 Tax=Streptomyces sp. NPDC005820 TaxID=3157069 RepID=UPI0033E69B2C